MIALAYIGAALGFTCLLIVLSALCGQPDDDPFEGNRDFHQIDPDGAEVWDLAEHRKRREPDHPAVRHHDSEGA